MNARYTSESKTVALLAVWKGARAPHGMLTVFGDDEEGCVKGSLEDGHRVDRQRGPGNVAGGAAEDKKRTDEEQ